ncbi:unnamed protein product [Ectocarpus sp. CCAP 1310/34]|nr:unnamed protein product [Ectocarpus sp. CCAP 1310/34]
MLLEAGEDGGRSTTQVAGGQSLSASCGIADLLFASPAALSSETSFDLASMRVALKEAVDSGHVDESAVKPILVMAKVASLLSESVDSSDQLHVSASQGQEVRVATLLAEGAKKNGLDAQGRTPLHLAVENGHLSTVKALLAADPDTSVHYRIWNRSYSVLDFAAQKGDACVLRAILQHGVDVNRRTDGYTSLHVAALNNRVAAIDVLVEAGAHVEVEDDDDCTPFLDACSNHCHEAALALFKHGANIEARDMRGETPLIIAARQAGRQGVTAIVDMLLRCGADETALNPDGRTAAEVVGHHIEYAACPLNKQDLERVRDLLENAPADRAWRRRGLLVLCRAFWIKSRRLRAASSSARGIGPRAMSVSIGVRVSVAGGELREDDDKGRRKQGCDLVGGGVGERNVQADTNRTWQQPRETASVGRTALVVAMVCCSTMASSCGTLLGTGHEWRPALWKDFVILCQRSSIRSRGRPRPVQ